MAKTEYLFYGIRTDEEDTEELWEALHKHFEKLAREDDVSEETIEGKGATK